MRVDQLRIATRSTEIVARSQFGRHVHGEGFARPELVLGLCVHFELGTLPPIAHLRELANAHGALAQAHLLVLVDFGDSLLGALPRRFRARFQIASTSRTGSALAHFQRFAIDALMAQPLQSQEGITLPHAASLAKRSRPVK
jgi:hypothetical protein